VIGLQEATLYRVRAPGGGAERQVDYLAILDAALRERGMAYRVAHVQPAAVAEAPAAGGAQVHLTDRDAILVREGMPVAGTASARYEAALTIQLAGAPFTTWRGWVAVDLPGAGGPLRVVCTHLDAYASPIQLAQARELTSGPGAAPGAVVLLGDFNTWPDERGRPTYEHLLAAGFTDAWTAAGTGPGFTHAQTEDLRLPARALNARLDLVLLRGPVVTRAARLVGDQPGGRTRAGLWPSDHVGVVATLEVG
jgi:endonuclease/exonuclease/phosphatase family metal-dependent hydrolase